MSDINMRTLLEAFIENSKTTDCPVHEYAFIDPNVIPFKAEVRRMCEQNLCGMYGKTWTCPPGVGDWQELRDKYHAYAHALVYSTRHELEDSFDYEGMTEGNHAHHRLDDSLIRKLKESGLSFAALGAEGCRLCAKCAYPDAPCRHPDIVHPSMESTGISVVDLTRLIGMHYINGANTVTYFSALFWND